MNRSAKIIKETSISFVGMTFGQAARYVFIALMARTVGARYLGIFSIANSITRLAEVFANAGLDTGLLRQVSMRSQDRKSEALTRDIHSVLKMSLVFSLLMMGLQLILARWLVNTFFHANPILVMSVIVFAVSLPFTTFTLVAGAATQGFKLLKYKIFVAQIFVPTVLVIAVVLTYYLSGAIPTVYVPSFIAALAGAAAIYYFLKKLAGISLTGILTAAFNFDILKYSSPIMFVAVLGTVIHWSDVLMLGYFMDETTVGLYHPAARTAGLIRAVMLSFMGIFSPMISDLWAKNDLDGMVDLYKLVSRWILSMALPIAIIFTLYSRKVMLLFGGEFIPSHEILIILTGAVLIQAFFGAGGSLLTMTDYPKINLVNSVVVTLVNIGLNVVWIPAYGIYGAAYSTFTAFALVGIIRTIEIQKILQINQFGLKLLKPVIAGTGSALAGYLVKPWIMHFHTVITLSLGSIVIVGAFIVILWMLRFDEDDKSIMAGLMMIKKK